MSLQTTSPYVQNTPVYRISTCVLCIPADADVADHDVPDAVNIAQAHFVLIMVGLRRAPPRITIYVEFILVNREGQLPDASSLGLYTVT